MFSIYLQVYANLDIATAKATREEQSRAKHHLLDVATPNEPFTVVHFRNKALPIVSFFLYKNAIQLKQFFRCVARNEGCVGLRGK